MSRYIDPDSPLSAEDREYLTERGKTRTIRIMDAQHGTGPSPTGVQPAPQEPAGSGPSGAGQSEQPTEPTNSAEEIEWVEGLTADELREELLKESQPTGGKKDELQKRLLKVLAAQD